MGIPRQGRVGKAEGEQRASWRPEWSLAVNGWSLEGWEAEMRAGQVP